MKKLIVLIALLFPLSWFAQDIEGIENSFFSFQWFEKEWFSIEKKYEIEDFTYTYYLLSESWDVRLTIYNNISNSKQTDNESERIIDMFNDFNLYSWLNVSSKSWTMKDGITEYYFSWEDNWDTFPMELSLSKWNISYKIEWDARRELPQIRKAFEMYSKLTIYKEDIIMSETIDDGKMSFNDFTTWNINYDNLDGDSNIVWCHKIEELCFNWSKNQWNAEIAEFLYFQITNNRPIPENDFLSLDAADVVFIDDKEAFVIMATIKKIKESKEGFNYSYLIWYQWYGIIIFSSDLLEDDLRKILNKININSNSEKRVVDDVIKELIEPLQ